jgi:hypothetical protein
MSGKREGQAPVPDKSVTVMVSFRYDPDDPDPDDRTGVSSEEYDQLTDQLMMLGAYDIAIQKEP